MEESSIWFPTTATHHNNTMSDWDSNFETEYDGFGTTSTTRSLAVGGGSVVIDYTVFSMALVTMIFLFIVGAIRHQIDHWARGVGFFETVMEACYHELSTLGIVEAVIFILHKYYAGLVVKTEMVFAEVHFTLFFVVIINAIMSSLLYFLSSRVAKNQWVRMEAIDLDHYVAVRNQFDDVNKKIEELKANQIYNKAKKNANSNGNKKSDNKHQRAVSFDLREEEVGSEEIQRQQQNYYATDKSNLSGHSSGGFNSRSKSNSGGGSGSGSGRTEHWFTSFYNDIVTKNVLKKKHRELLVQVRFHELRVHFIESHKLPPNFKVSNYLKLCLNDEFKNLVHVNSLSWVTLMVFTNIIYFLMGIIYLNTQSEQTIGTALSWIYLGYAIAFVIISYIVSLKMKQIFFRIVKDETWIQTIKEGAERPNGEEEEVNVNTNANTNTNANNRQAEYSNSNSISNLSNATLAPVDEDHRQHQNEYFWGSNPSYVVTMAQLMQFGYAICFAILLVFNDRIAKKVRYWYGWYLITPLLCYMIYLSLWCVIMPKYTQCTSLGELVRKTHLIDIDARSKLDKAKTKRQEEIDYLVAEEEVAKNMEERAAPQRPQRQRQNSGQSNILSRIFGAQKEDEAVEVGLDLSANDGSLSASERLFKISELVKQPTAKLQEELDLNHIERRRRQRGRSRSLSDGVASMRLFSTTSAVAEEALKADADADVSIPSQLEVTLSRPAGTRRNRKKMVSTGVFFMQSEKHSSFFDQDTGSKQENLDKSKTFEPFDKRIGLGMPSIGGTAPNRIQPRMHSISSKEKILQTKGYKSEAKLQLTPVKETEECDQNLQSRMYHSSLKPNDKPINENNHEKETSNGFASIKEPIEMKQHIEPHSVDTFSEDSSIISQESVEERVISPSSMAVIEYVSLGQMLRKFFLHKIYAPISAVVGTMVIFFCLSLRVEIILLDTCAMKDNKNTWDFIPNRVTAFWMVVAWFCFFVVESCVTCLLFGRRKENFNLVMVVAAVMDIILTFICLGLFVWAEVERCCNDCYQPSIFFRAATPNEESYCKVEPDSLCCPSFGSRLCGGVGAIEPISCLIALRLFRFEFARVLISCFGSTKRMLLKGEDDNEESNLEINADSANAETSLVVTEKSDEKVSFKHETGTIAELWILALEKYPDIVKEHGMFSGLVLEAMLGINPLPVGDETATKQTPLNDSKEEDNHSLTVDSLIESERIKRPSTLKRGISAMSLRSAAGSSTADLNAHDHNFLRPAASLVRSMRRCECKWKWLKSSLDTPWEMIDIVMTDFEIVWFDATSNPIYWDDAGMKRIQNVKESIIAKRGGKGLRLIDVAAGREVLGRLALTDIDHIRINRITPCSHKANSNTGTSYDIIDLEGNATPRKFISKEYWNDSNESCNLQLPLQKQWEQITEDRLRLHSTQGTLYLRFLVDLYHVVEPTLLETEIEKKKGALLWCESISHLCGRGQLKQKLPHFGEDRDHELPDFIETTDRMHDDDDGRKWKLRSLMHLNQHH